MGFIDNQRVISPQQRIGLCLSEQNTVRHQFHRDAGCRMVREPDLVAHDRAEVRMQFFRDALRNRACRDTARLRVANKPCCAAARHHAEFRELRGFS